MHAEPLRARAGIRVDREPRLPERRDEIRLRRDAYAEPADATVRVHHLRRGAGSDGGDRGKDRERDHRCSRGAIVSPKPLSCSQ
jgi:hypothetical protein